LSITLLTNGTEWKPAVTRPRRDEHKVAKRRTIWIKRTYLSPDEADGKRILVDRLWPRGLRREGARVDVWLKEVAPTAELRQWFGHDPTRWDEFRRRYFEELDENPAIDELREHMRGGPVTLLFGAKDEEHNNAVALKEFLER
jgi:uncharacterized protein YeaO (DUF488 family)